MVPAGDGKQIVLVDGEGLSRPLCVLAVDDNHDAGHALCLLLTAWGHRPLLAYDAASAWAAALAERPDVILLDLGLPGVNGWELARRLRSHPGLEGTGLIAVTAYGGAADRQRSRAAGIDHHLLKPVEPELLRQTLAAYYPRPGSDQRVS
jgi:two-component system CheB/CheR fusion protein